MVISETKLKKIIKESIKATLNEAANGVKYSKELDILFRAASEKNIVISVKSEKTAKTLFKRLIDCLRGFRYANPDVNDFGGEENWKVNILPKLLQTKIINKEDKFYPSIMSNVSWDYETLASVEKNKNLYKQAGEEYDGECFYQVEIMPGYCCNNSGRKSKNEVPMYTIKIVPSNETQTKKKINSNAVGDKIQEVINFLGTRYLPEYIHNRIKSSYNYSSSTERSLKKTLTMLDDFVKSATPIPMASEKQLSYASYLSGYNVKALSRLNKFQISEFINALKSENSIDKETIEFYKKML
jgi:hypothetical protein